MSVLSYVYIQKLKVGRVSIFVVFPAEDCSYSKVAPSALKQVTDR